MTHEEIAIESLAHAFTRRRNNGQVYMDNSSNPTPMDVQEATFFIAALIETGWRTPDAN